MYYIIFQTAFIGDIILSASMIKSIMQIDPQGKIIFVTTPPGNNILVNDKRIFKIIIYDKHKKDKGIKALFRKAEEIRTIISGEEAVFISPHRFFRASLIGYLTGSKIRTGFKRSSLSFLYNRHAAYRYGAHEVGRNFDLLAAAFGEKIPNISPERPELFPAIEDFKKVKSKVFNIFNRTEKIIAIAPGSVWATKRWPLENYRELISGLEDSGFCIILIGGKEDKELCDAVMTEGTLNLSGELSILESTAAVSLCKALVTNDSAPLHLASAMNIPAVAIFGATTPNLGFGPLSDHSVIIENAELSCRPCGRHGSDKCRKNHFECMRSIKPEIVLEAVKKIAEGE